MPDRINLVGTDAYIVRERGLAPFARRGGYCRESSWCFPSNMHFGGRTLWWAVLEDLGGFENYHDTFCEAWNALHYDYGLRELEAMRKGRA